MYLVYEPLHECKDLESPRLSQALNLFVPSIHIRRTRTTTNKTMNVNVNE